MSTVSAFAPAYVFLIVFLRLMIYKLLEYFVFIQAMERFSSKTTLIYIAKINFKFLHILEEDYF